MDFEAPLTWRWAEGATEWVQPVSKFVPIGLSCAQTKVGLTLRLKETFIVNQI